MKEIYLYQFLTLLSIVISIISVRYSLSLKQYLKEFTNVSKKISKKEFETRLDIYPKGEISELTKNFNEMIDIMHNTITEVENNKLQMESILKSISHGILAIDINSNIMLINSKAKRMLKCEKNENIEGSSIDKSIKEPTILKEITPFIGYKKSVSREVKINDDNVFLISIDPIYFQDNNIIIGSIINIKNITQRVRLENMRSDFVANVTHELKTPITSISGFVETLKLNENLDTSTRNRFLAIIESESDRLKRLIDDILFLSFIENREDISKDKIKIYDVFIEVYDMMNYLAKQKDIKLHYEIKDGIILNVNRDYIKQLFINIIENSIKYTPKEKSVFITIKNENNKFIFEVKDEGIGIPKEDINRIFERFYRVDKARSTEVGGTGLGLAITKHIVKKLGGSIKVYSDLGIGSTFIITLPIKK